MINEIVTRHRDGNIEEGVPNPSLEAVCSLVASAARDITPKVAKKAFRNTGLTLAIDGSEDEALSPSLKSLLANHNQDPKLREEDLARFSSPQPPTPSPMAKIFQVLCGDATKLKKEDFQPEMVVSAKKKAKHQR
jgi:hypothetical protein